MSKLSKAPLVEAIVEIRWGRTEKKNEGNVFFDFSKEDINFFPGQFRGIATKNGFGVVETINEPLLPHLVNYRFRKKANTWPCYQIGLGLFTVNQINNGYDWKTFKQDVIAGIEMLNEGHPLSLEKLPITSVELKYQDVFLLGKNESPSGFLREKLNIGFKAPDEFLKMLSCLDKDVHGHSLSFQVKTAVPDGMIRLEIFQARINDTEGFVMNTIMGSEMQNMNVGNFSKWLEDAHSTQRLTFEKLITPTFLKSFK